MSTTAEQEFELCICGHNRQWHREHAEVAHSFNTKSLIRRSESPSNGEPVAQIKSGMPTGDPVLRIVMMRKGLISLEDIEEVERELKTAGISIASSRELHPSNGSTSNAEGGLRSSNAQRPGDPAQQRFDVT